VSVLPTGIAPEIDGATVFAGGGTGGTDPIASNC